MPPRNAATRIRLGAASLAASALLLFLSSAIPIAFADPTVDPRAFAEEVSSPFFTSALIVHFVVGVLGIFGFFGLYCYLANSRAERWAFVGLVLCIVGFSAGLVGDGVLLTFPTIGGE